MKEDKAQLLAQLLYKEMLVAQIGNAEDTVEEMLFDDEVIFSEELNRKLTEWLMHTEEICSDLSEMAKKEFEELAD